MCLMEKLKVVLMRELFKLTAVSSCCSNRCEKALQKSLKGN